MVFIDRRLDEVIKRVSVWGLSLGEYWGQGDEKKEKPKGHIPKPREESVSKRREYPFVSNTAEKMTSNCRRVII